MTSNAEKPLPSIDEKDVGSDTPPRGGRKTMTQDEYHLATLGYKQVFVRSFGIIENWAATVNTLNFVNALPIMFGFAMYTGGPQAALANWTMVGGLALMVSLSMAEIAAAFPTCGGIYFWSYRLGGHEWGPLLSWITAWFNWAGWITCLPGLAQGNTNFLLSALQILHPNSEVLTKAWFGWILSTITILIAMAANIISRSVIKFLLRITICSLFLFLSFYWIWFPIKASHHFQPRSVLTTFYNGINLGPEKQASDSYCWMIGILYGAWDFYGYDASVHLAEETKQASSVVARGMWLGVLATWLLSVPTLIILLFCMQDFDGVVNGSYANNFAAYLMQLIGPKASVAVLLLLWIDGTLGAIVVLLSAQRITYAIARDGILPFSKVFATLDSRNKLPVNAAVLVAVLAIALNATVIGSTVAFGAFSATSTIAINCSYLVPIVARHTLAKNSFQPAKWNLGRYSLGIAVVAGCYVCLIFVVLLLPQLWPVTAVSGAFFLCNLEMSAYLLPSLRILSVSCSRSAKAHWSRLLHTRSWLLPFHRL